MKITAILLITGLLALLIFPDLRTPVVFVILGILYARIKQLARQRRIGRLAIKEMKRQGLID